MEEFRGRESIRIVVGLLLCGGRDTVRSFRRTAGHPLTPSDKCVGDIALICSRSFIGGDHLSEEPVIQQLAEDIHQYESGSISGMP